MSNIISCCGKSNFSIFLLANAETKNKLLASFEEMSVSYKLKVLVLLPIFHRTMLGPFELASTADSSVSKIGVFRLCCICKRYERFVIYAVVPESSNI